MAAIRFSTIFITSVIVILWASSINGDKADAGAYPHLVAIKFISSNTARCNGHIISPSWILSTGTCIHNYTKTQLQVQYGITQLSVSANIVNISELILHPNFNSKTKENDVGLIKLEKDLEFDAITQPTKLPPKNYIPSVGRICKTVGWFGDFHGNSKLDLEVINATIMSDIDCSKIRNEKIEYTEICAKHSFGRLNCTSGSGSGLVIDTYLYGLAIKGPSPCEGAQKPTVYTKIISYYSWIFENIVKYELEDVLKAPELRTTEMLKSFYAKLQSQLPEVYRISYEIIDFILRNY